MVSSDIGPRHNAEGVCSRCGSGDCPGKVPRSIGTYGNLCPKALPCCQGREGGPGETGFTRQHTASSFFDREVKLQQAQGVYYRGIGTLQVPICCKRRIPSGCGPVPSVWPPLLSPPASLLFARLGCPGPEVRVSCLRCNMQLRPHASPNSLFPSSSQTCLGACEAR